MESNHLFISTLATPANGSVHDYRPKMKSHSMNKLTTYGWPSIVQYNNDLIFTSIEYQGYKTLESSMTSGSKSCDTLDER